MCNSRGGTLRRNGSCQLWRLAARRVIDAEKNVNRDSGFRSNHNAAVWAATKVFRFVPAGPPPGYDGGASLSRSS